ncbi:MAG: hypothetical protein EOO04_38980, partial [Chitinophagaceae bacterium]
YNRGAAKARFDHLCFSHEDVVYHTQDWGKNLIAHLADPEVGVIGVCGSLVKPKSPSGVWLNNDAADRLSMYQTDSNGKPYHVFGNPDRETISEVKTLDGVFLCCRKEVWKKNKFDQDNLKNFHGYDVDFSLQVSQSYKNYVVYDIQLEHFSYGTNTPAWVESVVAIEKKWSDTLPSFTKGFDPKMINTIEHYSLGYFLTAVIENKLVSKKYLSYYLRMIKQKPLDRANFRLLRLYWRTRKKNIGKVG